MHFPLLINSNAFILCNSYGKNITKALSNISKPWYPPRVFRNTFLFLLFVLFCFSTFQGRDTMHSWPSCHHVGHFFSPVHNMPAPSHIPAPPSVLHSLLCGAVTSKGNRWETAMVSTGHCFLSLCLPETHGASILLSTFCVRIRRKQWKSNFPPECQEKSQLGPCPWAECSYSLGCIFHKVLALQLWPFSGCNHINIEPTLHLWDTLSLLKWPFPRIQGSHPERNSFFWLLWEIPGRGYCQKFPVLVGL